MSPVWSFQAMRKFGFLRLVGDGDHVPPWSLSNLWLGFFFQIIMTRGYVCDNIFLFEVDIESDKEFNFIYYFLKNWKWIFTVHGFI